MDRYSLGLSVNFSHISVCLLNLENLQVGLKLTRGYEVNDVLSMLENLEVIFNELKEEDFLQQVVMIKIVADVESFVVLKNGYLNSLLKFNGYVSSLTDFFSPLLAQKEVQKIPFLSNQKFDLSLQPGVEILPLPSFICGCLTGKNAPVDQEFASHLSRFLTKEDHSKLLNFKQSDNVFSYAGSYFVEKFSIPNEAQVLPAGDKTSMAAYSSGSPVFCLFDTELTIGVIVNGDQVDGHKSIDLGGDQYLIRLSGLPYFDNRSYSDLLSIRNPSNFKKESYQLIDFKCQIESLSVDRLDLFVNQLVRVDDNIRKGVAVHLMEVGEKQEIYGQLLANVINEDVCFNEYSDIGSALGAAIFAGRKFLELSFSHFLEGIKNNYPFAIVSPNNDQMNIYSELIKVKELQIK